MFEKKKTDEKLNITLFSVLIGLSVILIIICVFLLISLESVKKDLKDYKTSINKDLNSPDKKDQEKNSPSIDITEKKDDVKPQKENDKEVSENDKEKENNGEVSENLEDLKITFIEDSREPATDVEKFVEQLKGDMPSVASAEIVVKDFSDEGMKDYVKDNNISYLPAVIFSTKNYDSSKDPQDLKAYLKDLPNGEYMLNIGANYDPFAENCNNGADDNEDGLVDCKDPKCSTTLECAPKVDKPKAELFIMSYCPYGTQAQKGFLEAMLKLDKLVDMKIRFVSYLMHGEKEGEENIVQYCIQKDQNDKFKDYLKCFLKEGKGQECRKESKIDENDLKSCIDSTKKDINYDENISDKTRNFPVFDLDKSDNQKYGVQGSPTFVLNGIKIDKVGRSAKAYADLICSTFKEKPAVCNEEFSNVVYDPNFGFTTNGTTVSGACGG